VAYAAFTLSGFDGQDELDNKKVLFYKHSVRYLVVKPACVNASLVRKGHGNVLNKC